MDSDREAERLRAARQELANKLYPSLGLALAAGLSAEAAIIAKLIEATLMNTAIDIYVKLR